MKQSVIGIGEALFDVHPEGKKLGGAPANFAYHVSQFGIESCAVSAKGDDELGKELIAELDVHHLNYQIETVDYPTGTVQVSLDANGIPAYDIKEGAAWDNMPFTPALEEKAKNCTAVCFGRDRSSDNEHQKYSTFVYAEYPIYKKEGWKVDAGVGGAFALNKAGEDAHFFGTTAGIVHVSLQASHDLKIGKYTIPVYAKGMWNPQSDKAYFQLGAEVIHF